MAASRKRRFKDTVKIALLSIVIATVCYLIIGVSAKKADTRVLVAEKVNPIIVTEGDGVIFSILKHVVKSSNRECMAKYGKTVKHITIRTDFKKDSTKIIYRCFDEK